MKDLLERYPDDTDVLRSYARILVEKFEYTRASEIFESLKMKSIQDADVFTYIGICQYHQEKYHEAIDSYKKALELEKLNPYYLNQNIAECYFEMNQLDKAEECSKKALKEEPDYSDSLKTLEQINIIRQND